MEKDILWQQIESKLNEQYGSDIPLEIVSRFLYEKQALEKSNAVVSLVFCAELVKEAEKLGLRISINDAICAESLSAYLLGITVLNPLPPHYRCPQCHAVEFVSARMDGWDLPEKTCSCGAKMERDGHNFCNTARWGGVKDLLSPVINCSSWDFRRMALALFRRYFPDRTLITLTLPERMESDPFLAMWVVPSRPGIPEKLPLTPEEYGITKDEFIEMRSDLPQFSFYPGNWPEDLCRMEQVTGISADQIEFDSRQMLEEFVAGGISALPKYTFYEEHGQLKELGALYDVIHPTTVTALLKFEGLLYITNDLKLDEEYFSLLQSRKVSPEEMIVHREDLIELITACGKKQSLPYAENFAQDILDKILQGTHKKSNGLTCADLSNLEKLGLPAWVIQILPRLTYLHPRCSDLKMLRTAMIRMWFKIHYPEEYYSAYNA